MSERSASIFSLKFWLLCISSFLFSSSFNMLIPELPSYLTKIGGAGYKGYIIALFTFTAGISRPFSGRLTDTIGRVPVMAIGSLVCFVCGFLYPVWTSVAGFLFIRLIHGFSTGFKPTATAAYISDIIPANRWGEAMGIHGLCFSTGLAIGPAVGSYITSLYSFNTLFYISSAFAFLSIAILLNLQETHQQKQPFRLDLLKLHKKDIIEPLVLPAAAITFLGYVSYGTVLTLIPDWSDHLGIRNKGLFFIVFTASSLLVRLAAGRLSDRKGRVYVLKIALSLIAISVCLIGWARSIPSLMTGTIIYGIGVGIFSPASAAWTADLSNPEHRGRAMATMYIALEAGIGIGALAAGWLFQENLERIPMIFYSAAMITACGMLYLMKTSWQHPAQKS
ncbi:MAG TPA: MFS transporter [Chitinophagaceae bacterium]|nr:MFS transporter [Chitinophagaceae bacterium]